MQDTGIFQQILDAMTLALQPGAEAIRAQLLFYFQIFLFFELLRTMYAFVWNGRLLEPTMAVLGRGALVYWALLNFPTLLQGVQEQFVELGLLAGGGRLQVAQFLDPGEYLRTGLRVMALLYSKMHLSFGLTSLGQAVGYFFLWLAFMASFAVMALNVMIWQVELLLAGLMMLTLLPTLAFRSWAWIGQGSLGAVINLTFRFGVGALISSLTFPVLNRLTITTPVSFQSVIVSVIGGWFFAILFWQCNKLASLSLSGMASLSAGTVFSAAMGSAITAGAVLSGAAALGGGALGLAGAAGKGLMAARSGGSAAAGVLAQSGGGGPGQSAGAGSDRGPHGGHPEPPEHGGLAGRLSTAAGGGTRLARGAGSRSLRGFADTARYVGQDHAGAGVRH